MSSFVPKFPPSIVKSIVCCSPIAISLLSTLISKLVGATVLTTLTLTSLSNPLNLFLALIVAFPSFKPTTDTVNPFGFNFTISVLTVVYSMDLSVVFSGS